MTPRVFWLHINYMTEPKGKVWTVAFTDDRGVRQEWNATRVTLTDVDLETVFRGADHRQPKAFLRGEGVILRAGSEIHILPE